MIKRWNEQKERSNSFALNLICWVALHAPRSVTRVFLYPITLYFLVTSPGACQASRYFQKRVFERNISFREVARHFFWFASTILDRVYFLTGRFGDFDIKIYGRELVDERLAKSEGCILIGSHAGSFEVLRSLAVNTQDMPLKVMMYRSHNEVITRILDTLNPRISESVIDLADSNALLKLGEFVAQGDLVGILGDRVSEGDRTIACQFMGGPVEFNTGPFRLAAVLEVPVIFFIGLYMGGNRYEIHFESLGDYRGLPRSKRDFQVRDNLERYVGLLEEYVRRQPHNWFNYYDYWKEDRAQNNLS